MLRHFQDSFIFGEATSSQFFEWQLRHNSYVFGAAVFFSFLRTVTFSQQLFFQNGFFFMAKILQNSHFLRIKSSSWHLLFRTAIFSLFRIKISKKELLFQSRYFCTVSTFSEKLYFGKKLIFQKSNIPHCLLFLESCFFRAPIFSKDGTFCSSYLFRRATFLQHTFSEKLLFHSYASLPQLHFLFIR